MWILVILYTLVPSCHVSDLKIFKKFLNFFFLMLIDFNSQTHKRSFNQSNGEHFEGLPIESRIEWALFEEKEVSFQGGLRKKNWYPQHGGTNFGKAQLNPKKKNKIQKKNYYLKIYNIFFSKWLYILYYYITIIIIKNKETSAFDS